MPDPDRIIRIRTVLNRTGLSRSTLYRKMADGSFPQRLKLGASAFHARNADYPSEHRRRAPASACQHLFRIAAKC